MQIRELREDERDAAQYLSSQAFRHGERDTSSAPDPNRLPSVTFGVWDEAGLQAKVVVIAYQMHFGPNVVIPMGGIAGVASLPASRGKGYAGKCMKHTLERMKEAGQPISSLYPFSWDYYRRLGYEWVGVLRSYKISTRVFKSSPETEHVRAAADSDREKIFGCYTQYAGRYRGPLQRDSKIWNRILDHGDKNFTYTYLYEREGNIEGYLTYRGGKREETRLREFVTLTPRALNGLLGLLRRHEMQIEKFVWDAPSDDILWSQVYHWDIETKLEPVTQGRIVDVSAAFQALKPETGQNGVVTFDVQDEAAPWNQGTWRVEMEAGHVSVMRTDAAPELSFDIQALSQAFFGMPTLDAIRAADRLTVHEERGFQTLKTLLGHLPMWTNDSF